MMLVVLAKRHLGSEERVKSFDTRNTTEESVGETPKHEVLKKRSRQ